MSERELKSITFEDLGITYVIPSSGSSSGDVPKVVEDHMNNKNNPHGVTAAQIDAAPAQIISGSIQPSTAEDLETQIKEMYTNMGINTRKFAYANITFTGAPLGGGIWQLTLAKTTNEHGFIIAEHYGGANNTPAVKARTIYNGVWNDWVDVGASAFAPASHSQAASTITGGTFAGPVYASATAQAPVTCQLRNSRIATSELPLNNNGEICWIYE